MNNERLDELIAIPKKTDASKAIKKEYKAEISKLLKEEGFSENAEKYLWGGFSFCGAEALFDFINFQAVEDQPDIIDALFKCRHYTKNEKSNGFKMCISLLAYELNYCPDKIEIIEKLIKSCIGNYKKKDGSISKDNNKIVEKYFVSIISDQAKLPDWSAFSLKAIIIHEFCNYIISACNSITGDKLKNQVNNIIDWLKSSLPNNNVRDARVTEALLNETNDTSKQNSEATLSNGENSKAVSPDNVSSAQNIIETNSLVNIAAQLKVLSSRVFLLAEESEKDKKVISHLEAEGKETANKLNASQEIISQLQDQLIEKEADLTSQKTYIEDLTAEIEKLKAIISVYSEDKQSSMDGQLNAIASKLKTEYREFKDALDFEMTVEIGEILRDQLKRVFKTLSKAGIDIESR